MSRFAGVNQGAMFRYGGGSSLGFSHAAGIGFAVAGGILSFLQARSQNRAIRENQQAIAAAARISQEQLNAYITQLRVRSSQELQSRSLQAQETVAMAQGRLAEGVSTSQYMAANIAGAAGADAETVRMERQNAEIAAEQERANIVAGATSQVNQLRAQTQSPVLAATTGALQGFSLGTSLDLDISRLKVLKSQSRFLDRLMPIQRNLNALRISGHMAAMSWSRYFEAFDRKQLHLQLQRNAMLGASVR